MIIWEIQGRAVYGHNGEWTYVVHRTGVGGYTLRRRHDEDTGWELLGEFCTSGDAKEMAESL